MTDIAGLILAAGAGRRMGRPKALVHDSRSGLTWVEQAVCRVLASGVTLTVVVVGAESEAVSQVLQSGAWAKGRDLAERGEGGEPGEVGAPDAQGPVSVVIVDCPDWEQGMGASVTSGLEALTAMDEDALIPAVLVTLVDLPDVTADVHRRVLDATTASPDPRAALVRAAYQGKAGHPVVLGRDHWVGVSAAATGDRGARDYLASREVELVECGDLATGRDVDRPNELT